MKRGWVVAFSVSLVFITACASRRAIRSLDPESQDFLSKARYLISKDERRAFLALPGEEERKIWIEDFWRRRDPRPETEVNEFKVEYYRRIDEANRLFKEGSTPGWLSDRGHMYITLGPPDNRETYPRGITFYGLPTEIWYYGFFPIVFIDDNWSGNYRLAPDSAVQIGEINKTQNMLHPNPPSGDQIAASLNLEVAKVKEGEAIVGIKLPYKDIWLKAEGNRLETTLEIVGEASDSSGKIVWTEKKTYPLSFSKDEFLKVIRQDFLIEIPIRLSPGEYSLRIRLKNTGGGGEVAEKKEKLVL